MRLKQRIYITLLATAILSACTDYDVDHLFTVGEADNAITLHAGVAEGGSGVMTRGVDGNHAGNASGGAHTPLKVGTKMTLRVDGKWLGKADNYALPHGKVTSQVASQTTTATVGSAFKGQNTDENNTHNEVSMNPQLYWDDYGTADPANMSPNTGNGRDKGLTIYGAAVDDATVTDAPTVSDWTALQWSLPADQTGGWTAKDLITSNNIRVGADGTYKFDALKPASTLELSNLLEFTHAMSKITVELTAREGFNGWSTETPNAGTFTGAPTVTLKSFKYKGNVSVEAKTSTPDDAVSDITMHLASGGASSHTATFDAIVFPGNEFADGTEILTFTADGNTFKVTAAELNAAILTARTNYSTTGYPNVSDNKLQQGWNYNIRITVDKTKIQVLATVVNWEDVTADPAYPKISVTESYGIELGDETGKEPAFENDFDFFVSENIASGYDNKAWIEYQKVDSKDTYTMHDQLYWPNHQIHYFFRGVWPRVGTNAGEVTAANVKSATDNASTIDVQNVTYTANTYPSDLMIGYPRVAAGKKCPHNEEVATNGICATEGSVIMNFRYAMSQVKVILETTTTGDKVKIDNTTKVEIVNGYTGGSIKLEDGSAVGSTKGTYTMHQESTSAEDGSTPAKATYHDAILPQNLTLDSKDLLFRVTIDNGDGTTDVYECPIKDIYVPTGSTTKISAWESGTSYTYTLTIKKTAISAVATITPWTTVTASQPVWF